MFLPISFPFLDSMMHLCWIDLGSKQLLDPDKVDVVQRLDKEKGVTLEEFRLIKIHMSLRKLISSLPSHPLTRISRFFLLSLSSLNPLDCWSGQWCHLCFDSALI